MQSTNQPIIITNFAKSSQTECGSPRSCSHACSASESPPPPRQAARMRRAVQRFTCGDYAALRVNCSATLYMGCACKGCCTDGTAAATKEVEASLSSRRQSTDTIVTTGVSEARQRRALFFGGSPVKQAPIVEEEPCIVPLDLSTVDLDKLAAAVNLSAIDLSALLRQDGAARPSRLSTSPASSPPSTSRSLTCPASPT